MLKKLILKGNNKGSFGIIGISQCPISICINIDIMHEIMQPQVLICMQKYDLYANTSLLYESDLLRSRV